jgi:site-specific DNA-cytosine methylase
MLQPKELAGAMSLDGYKFTGTKGDQVKQIGNAWPRRLGQALIQSLLVDYATRRKAGDLEAIA